MDCKEEITNVIILMLVRDLLQKGPHESSCGTCGVRGEKIGRIFKTVSEDSDFYFFLDCRFQLRRSWCLLSFEIYCARTTNSCVIAKAFLVIYCRVLFMYL